MRILYSGEMTMFRIDLDLDLTPIRSRIVVCIHCKDKLRPVSWQLSDHGVHRVGSAGRLALAVADACPDVSSDGV